MATWYASSTGLAGNAGTLGSPKSLAGASAATSPGDTVLLLGGTYNLSAPFTPAHSGTAGNWITYRNYDATPVNIVWVTTSLFGMFEMNSRNYIAIQGLSFDGKGFAGSALTWRHSHHCRAVGNRVQNCGVAGIGGRQNDYYYFDSNLVTHCGYNGGWSSGINLNQTRWEDHAPGFHNVVINNIVSGQYDSSGHNTDGNGIIMDLSTAGTYDPLTADTPPTLIVNNVVYQNGGRGIHCYIVTNIWVVNNTVVYNGLDQQIDGGHAGNVAERFATNCYFINNIAVSWDSRYAYEQSGTPSPLGGFLHYEKDIWNGGSNNFSNAALLHHDPLFINLAALGTPTNGGYTSAVAPWNLGTALELTSASPARNAGIDPRTILGVSSDIIAGLTAYALKDIKGITRPQGTAWDIGAYEFVEGTGGGPTNTPPLAVADAYTAVENITLTVTAPGVLANDADVDGDPLTAVLVSNVSHGALTLHADGSFVYVPTTSYTGADSFTYHAYDGQAYSNIVTVSLTVTAPISTSPIAVADSYTIATNLTLTVVAPGVLGNDTNFTGNAFTAVLNTNVSHGTLSLSANGSFTYSATGGYTGTDSFTYHAYDTVHSSSIVTVTITVTAAVYDSPVAVANSYTVANNASLSISAPGVLANDINHTPFTFTAVLNTTTTHGTLSLSANGSFTYTPSGSYTGTDSFTYHCYDTVHNSNVVTVTITVTAPVSTNPIAVSDNYTTANDVTLTRVAPGVLTNDNNFTVHAFTAVLDTDVSHGVLALSSDGSFTYTATTGYTGSDHFTYHANDTVNDSNIVTVTITVTAAVHGSPLGVVDFYTVPNNGALAIVAPGVLGNDVNYTVNAFTAVLFLSTTHGALSLSADGSFTYTPNSSYTGIDQFVYRAYDTVNHSALVGVTITVTSAAHANPLAVADSYTIANNNVLTVSAPGVLTNDTNFTTHTFTAVLDTNVSHGVLTLNSNGSFSYDPDDSFVGVDSYTYHAYDTVNSSTVVTVSITVTVAGGGTPSPYQLDEWAIEPLGYDGFRNPDLVRALSLGFNIASSVDVGQAIAEVVFEGLAISSSPISLMAVAEVIFEGLAIASLPAGETYDSNPKQ